MLLSQHIPVNEQIALLIKEGWFDDARDAATLCLQHRVISAEQFAHLDTELHGRQGTQHPGHKLYGAASGFDGSTLLSSLQFKKLSTEAEMKAAFKQAVSKIEIETSTQCNRRCHYCPNSQPEYHHRREKNAFFDMDMFESLLSDLKQIDYDRKISLVGMNEFFMHAGNIEYLRLIKRDIPRSKVAVYSNGDYLNREVLAKVESLGLDTLLVSFHLQAGKAYSMDEVLKRAWNFQQNTKVPLTLTAHESGGRLEFQAQFGKLRIIAGLVDWTEKGHNWNGTVDCGKAVLESSIPCQAPVNILCLCQNGDFSLCCSTPRERNKETLANNTILGNLGDFPSIFAAYGSEKMLHWRQRSFSTKHLPTLCQGCNQRTQQSHVQNKPLAAAIEAETRFVDFPAEKSAEYRKAG